MRLIEENLWCNGDEVDCLTTMPEESKKNYLYLRRNVYPTLVPALYELAQIVQDEQEGDEANDEQDAAPREGLCDAKVDPILWIAQYLLRNNVKAATSRVRNHPYNIVSAVSLSKVTGEAHTPM